MSAKEKKGDARNNSVGPVLRPGELASAVIEAARDDNPGKEVVVADHAAYIRVSVEGECILQRESIERHLGRPFFLAELEVDLAAIAGQLDVNETRMRFYFNHAN